MSSVTTSAPVTTTLVHRVQRRVVPWWRECVVCDFTGGADPAALVDIAGLLPDLARTGLTTISVRPAHVDLTADPSPLAPVIAGAHRVGLTVLVRLAGAGLPTCRGAFLDREADFPTVVVRTRAALKAGADGIDLGVLADEADDADPGAPERSTRFVRLLHAELADFDRGPVLAARATVSDEAAFGRHLEEDWFHHLRDDALLTCPWDAEALLDAVTTTYATRDPLGQVAAWNWSDSRHCADASSVPPGSWEDGCTASRRAAMALFGLSLPGAAYVPFGHLAGRSSGEDTGVEHRSWAPDAESRAEAEVLSRALHLRGERHVGQGSLAIVRNLPWAPPGVGVHMTTGMMVVVNTTGSDVEVPAEHAPLVRSDGRWDEPGSATVLPPDTAGWFETARVTPPPVTFGP